MVFPRLLKAACEIAGAAGSALYTPGADDVMFTLHAVATYKDNIDYGSVTARRSSTWTELAGGSTERPAQASDPANTAPSFPDQDLNTAGDQSDTAMRSVAENAKSATVGDPVTAGDGDNDLLTYSLSGDDADMFSVDNEGQIKTAVELDFESQAEHMVTLMAMDPTGAYDRIMVVVSVTDANDGAIIMVGPAENTAPAFADDAETDTCTRARQSGR